MQSGKKSKKLNFMQKMVVTFKEVSKKFHVLFKFFCFFKSF